MTSTQSSTGSRYLAIVAGALVLLALLVGLRFSSLQMMWYVWGDSNTYTHGYLVFPMVAYLIYLNRQAFADAPHRPVPLVALPLLGCGLLWMLASLMTVHVVAQLMFVSSIVLLCVGYFGFSKSATILFPLAYLFFAVPMGEGLVPRLMEFTADFSVWALQISGLPVYRDGMFISIPAGDFEVAKACSGIRYLMASFALGTLYAYLSFRSFKKQLLFSLLSLVVPILANGIRAYGIIMIAHMSDMKHAVGVDHLIYGWLFFGLVMFFLFYIGGKFRSDEDKQVVESASLTATETIPVTRLWIAAGALAAALILPHVAGSYARQSNSNELLIAALPAAVQGWSGPVQKNTTLEPEFSDAVSVNAGQYSFSDTGAEVYVWVYRYPAFDPNHEMITETNRLVDPNRWNVYYHRPRRVNPEQLPVMEAALGHRRDEFTVWYWYQINDKMTNGPVRAKLAEGLALLSGSFRLDEALVVVATPGRGEDAALVLERFMASYSDALGQCAVAADPECVVEMP